MSAPAKPRPVLACEAFWARVEGGDYAWTRAVQGYEPGEWHHACPGRCGGGITFAQQADGSLELRCRGDVVFTKPPEGPLEMRSSGPACSESEILDALLAGVVA